MGIVVSNDSDIFVTYMPNGIAFDKQCININLNSRGIINKPCEAWWGSPLDAEYGWKEWCESEEFGNYDFDNPIQWKLKSNTNILQIDMDDIIDYEHRLLKYIDRISTLDRSLNFYRLLDDNISTVQLMDACIGHAFINRIELMFNGWDCESICVLDKDVIEFI